MKVSVDFDVCVFNSGLHAGELEVFEVRSDGYLYILQEEPGDGTSPKKVREAADLCPTAAITIEE